MRSTPAEVLLLTALAASAIAFAPQSEQPESIRRVAERAIADALERAADAIENPPPGLTPAWGVYLVVDPDDAGNADLWATIDADHAPVRVVLLIHGLDEPGSIWNDLTPMLAEQGHTVARFEYPNDQAIATSADFLISELERLHALGVEQIDIVAHSMGGLVARDALTRPPAEARARPDVGRLIMVGTPHAGSPLAPLRGVAEARERIARWLDSDSWDLRPMFEQRAEGAGEAGVDLEPGSEYLIELSARPNAVGVEYTVIAGRIAALTKEEEQAIRTAEPARLFLGKDRTDRLLDSIRGLAEGVGDGVVPLDSALLPGVGDTVILEGSHRGMLLPIEVEQIARGLLRERQTTPPAIPIILDRLDHPQERADESADTGDRPAGEHSP